MSHSLEKAEKHAQEYKREACDAWEMIKHEHDLALFVGVIEDLVDQGIFVLRMWQRRADHWHAG